MNEVIAAVSSDQFWFGLIVGATVLGWLGVLAQGGYKKTLLLKTGPDATPERLGDGKFYYLVEESQYNHLHGESRTLQRVLEGIRQSHLGAAVGMYGEQWPSDAELEILAQNFTTKGDQCSYVNIPGFARAVLKLFGPPPTVTPEPEPQELDATGVPKKELTVMEAHAVHVLNLVKAWAESDRSTPFPEEAHQGADLVLGFAQLRRKGVQ